MTLTGHLWTIVPTLAHRLRPMPVPAAAPWSTTFEDSRMGPVVLRGLHRHEPDSSACLLVVHGLGGTTDTFYCGRAARAAQSMGISSLRLALRGADRGGDDFYHGGLIGDLEQAVASEAMARYERIYVLGYSLGGHVTLRYGLAPTDPRVIAVAAVCPPLDLDRSAQAIDHPRALVYRRHVLAGLNEIYAAVAARRSVPTPVEQVRAARTIRAWDSLTIVPRYGFDSVDHYYATMSAGPRLDAMQRPALVVHIEHDPMVPPWTYRDHLARSLPAVEILRLSVGGHVSFPDRVRLPDGRRDQLEPYLLRWLSTR